MKEEDPLVTKVRGMLKEALAGTPAAAADEQQQTVSALGVTFDGGYLAEMKGVYRETEEQASLLTYPVPVALLCFRDMDGTPMRPICLTRKDFKNLLSALTSIDEDFASLVLQQP